MNIPADFPTDIKAQFNTLNKAINENLAVSTAMRQQLSNDDYRKAMALVGVDSPKFNPLGVTSPVGTPVTQEQTFFQKNKTYIIVGGVLVVIVIVYFVIKRKK